MIYATFTVGNSYTVPRDSPYFDSTQKLRQVGWGMGYNERTMLDVIRSRVCPAAQLGFNNALVTNPGGTLAGQQMLVNQYHEAARSTPWLIADRIQVGRALRDAFSTRPLYYVGYPDPDSIPGYVRIATMKLSAWQKIGRLIGKTDPREAMYKALIGYHLQPWIDAGAKIVLDNCTGRWSSQGQQAPEWQVWYANWALDNAKDVGGIEPYWQNSVPSLWGLDAFSTSENQQRIDAGLANDWARQTFDTHPASLTVLCNATDPALPAPNLATGDIWREHRPVAIEALRIWANHHLDLGRNIALACDDFVKQGVNVREWLEGRAVLV